MSTGKKSSPARRFEVVPGLSVGAGSPLLLIAGPCQIESKDHSLMIAAKLKELCRTRGLNFIFKASYDKANRTSLDGVRGPGIDEGLKILAQVKKELSVPVLSDVHSAEEARLASEVLDVMQTPAFLCRQTDLLLEVGKSGKSVNCKKGQFLHPADMTYAAQKIASTGNNKIMLCERGSCFGYRDLVLDPRALVMLAEIGYPVIFDATHTVQSMGGKGGSSGGHREFIEPLLRAALAVGVDGLFIECHEAPERAPSDGASMCKLEDMPKLLDNACIMREAYLKTLS